MRTRPVIAVLAGVAGVLALGACGSDGSTAAARTTAPVATNVSTDASHGDHAEHTNLSSESPDLQCPMHMPGDLLTEAEAEVVFDAEHVCLSYVTITAGTTVTWNNADAADHDVIIWQGDTEIDRLAAPAGGSVDRTFDEVGVFQFSHTAIDGFRGSVEVQAVP